MKTLALILLTVIPYNLTFAQESSQPPSRISWFVNPEIGGIFHDDHFGKTLGVSFGVKMLNNHLKVGAQFYGRPGPINSQEYEITPSNGQTYKGKSTLSLRADHGTIGIFLAPVFDLDKVRIEIPLSAGTMGGGFYLQDEDRKTPDGDRVSVWENRLMDEKDASFSTFYEFGGRVFLPLSNRNVSMGLGLHYTLTPGWETYADPDGDLYNNRFRVSFVLGLEGS